MLKEYLYYIFQFKAFQCFVGQRCNFIYLYIQSISALNILTLSNISAFQQETQRLLNLPKMDLIQADTVAQVTFRALENFENMVCYYSYQTWGKITVSWEGNIARFKKIIFPLDITKLKSRQERIIFSRLTTFSQTLNHDLCPRQKLKK